MKGKILIAKDTMDVREIRTTANPTSYSRFTGKGERIYAGTMMLCVAEYPSGNSKIPSLLHFLHGESAYEAPSNSFSVAEPSTKLQGKSFCFTGAISHPREYYKALVELHGGTYASGVTKGLKYLVMADPRSKSTKAVKARSYGTECIDEKMLLALIQG